MSQPKSAPSPSRAIRQGKVPGRSIDEVVILREEDLAADPGAALARLRAAASGNEATRVLFVGPETGDGKPTGTLQELVAMPAVDAGLPVEDLAENALTEPAVMVEAMRALTADLVCELDGMAESFAAGNTRGCRMSVRAAREMVGWLADSCVDLDGCLGGLDIPAEEIPAPQLIGDVARRLQVDRDQIQFVEGMPGDPEDAVILGAPVAVRAALRLALELVTERIGGVGAVRIRADVEDGEVWVRVRGHGEPRAVGSGPRVSHLQGLMAQLGGRIESGSRRDSNQSTGMVLCFPAAPSCRTW